MSDSMCERILNTESGLYKFEPISVSKLDCVYVCVLCGPVCVSMCDNECVCERER